MPDVIENTSLVEDAPHLQSSFYEKVQVMKEGKPP